MSELEQRMRKLEWFHSLRVPEGNYIILRMDGRCFSKLTENLNHPFDDSFHAAMTTTTEEVFKELGCVYGETHSDEISLLLQPNTDMFDLEVEKLVSVSASLASGYFSAIRGKPASFDSRIIMTPHKTEVANYFLWRQMDCYRCCINSWFHWTYIQERGVSARAAHTFAECLTANQKNSTLFEEFGINVTTDIPNWQKRGTGFYWTYAQKLGFNPITNEDVLADRRVLHIESDLPHGDDYEDFLYTNLSNLNPGSKWVFGS